MHSYQYPQYQCRPDEGPIPTGNYYIALILGDLTEDDGTGRCNLKPSWQLQEIPRGIAAGDCEPYWANWGYNRVRFEAADQVTKTKCNPARGGFYLHDSTKGYSHGCIEVEGRFFNALREFLKTSKLKRLNLKVIYNSNERTNGGTYVR